MEVAPTPQDLTADEMAGVSWKISSFSNNGGASCVEAGLLGDGTGRVAVRHSHHPSGSVVVYTREEWNAFMAGARAGEFDFAD